MTSTTRQDVTTRPSRHRTDLKRLDRVLCDTQFRRFGTALCLCGLSQPSFDWLYREPGERLPRRLATGGLLTGRVLAAGRVPVVLLRQYDESWYATPIVDDIAAAEEELIYRLKDAGLPVVVTYAGNVDPAHDSMAKTALGTVCAYLCHVRPPVALQLGPELTRVLAGGFGELDAMPFYKDVWEARAQVWAIEARGSLKALRDHLEPHEVGKLLVDAGMGELGAAELYGLDLATATARELVQAAVYRQRHLRR